MTAKGGGRESESCPRKAIVDAARELIRTGAPVTIPEVARRPLYRAANRPTSPWSHRAARWKPQIRTSLFG